jgi:hypothetical protein
LAGDVGALTGPNVVLINVCGRQMALPAGRLDRLTRDREAPSRQPWQANTDGYNWRPLRPADGGPAISAIRDHR